MIAYSSPHKWASGLLINPRIDFCRNFTPFGAVTFSIGIFHWLIVYLKAGLPFDVPLTELPIFAFLLAETAFFPAVIISAAIMPVVSAKSKFKEGSRLRFGGDMPIQEQLEGIISCKFEGQ